LTFSFTLIFFYCVKGSLNKKQKGMKDMCFKGSEMCQATSAVQAERQPPKQPKTIDIKEFAKITARLRAGIVTPAGILRELDISEASIMPTRYRWRLSLNSARITGQTRSSASSPS
jgi:hypothetical protein